MITIEIKVDTKTDSVEDIKKAVEFLQKFIGESSDAPLASGAFNMFSENDSLTDNNVEISANTPPQKQDEGEEDKDFDMKPVLEPY